MPASGRSRTRSLANPGLSGRTGVGGPEQHGSVVKRATNPRRQVPLGSPWLLPDDIDGIAFQSAQKATPDAMIVLERPDLRLDRTTGLGFMDSVPELRRFDNSSVTALQKRPHLQPPFTAFIQKPIGV